MEGEDIETGSINQIDQSTARAGALKRHILVFQRLAIRSSTPAQ